MEINQFIIPDEITLSKEDNEAIGILDEIYEFNKRNLSDMLDLQEISKLCFICKRSLTKNNPQIRTVYMVFPWICNEQFSFKSCNACGIRWNQRGTLERVSSTNCGGSHKKTGNKQKPSKTLGVTKPITKNSLVKPVAHETLEKRTRTKRYPLTEDFCYYS